MKKKSLYLTVGILMIVFSLVLDTIVSNYILNFSDVALFSPAHWIAIVVAAILLIGGIVFIVLSRRLAKNENSEVIEAAEYIEE